jgi:hypothetical protein
MPPPAKGSEEKSIPFGDWHLGALKLRLRHRNINT